MSEEADLRVALPTAPVRPLRGLLVRCVALLPLTESGMPDWTRFYLHPGPNEEAASTMARMTASAAPDLGFSGNLNREGAQRSTKEDRTENT